MPIPCCDRRNSSDLVHMIRTQQKGMEDRVLSPDSFSVAFEMGWIQLHGMLPLDFDPDAINHLPSFVGVLVSCTKSYVRKGDIVCAMVWSSLWKSRLFPLHSTCW